MGAKAPPLPRSAMTGGQWPQARLAAARNWVDTPTCQLCNLHDGTLLHRHSCPATLPAGGWTAPAAGAAAFGNCLSEQRRQLLTTLALFALKVSLPLPPAGDSFAWIVPPPEDCIEQQLTWFVDGSLFDKHKRFLRRTGFGIAAVCSNGDLVAFGHGIPPHWIQDAAGAELWAVHFVISIAAITVPHIVTDCKGIYDSFRMCPSSLTDHDKSLARRRSLIVHALDKNFEEILHRLRWMPSHTSAANLSHTKDSDDLLITPPMWRANRLLDALVKTAAVGDRATS